MATTTCCYTADPTTLTAQSLLNITAYYGPWASSGNYNVTVSFPSYYTMGPQPYRAPLGTVSCAQPAIQGGNRLYSCSSQAYGTFFGVFNMIVPAGVNPRDGVSLTLNTATGPLTCGLAAWCADVGAYDPNSGGGNNGSLPMPVWEITVIASGCGILLGAALFIYAKKKTRAQRDSTTGHAPLGVMPSGGGGGHGTLMAKVAEAQNMRVAEQAGVDVDTIKAKNEAIVRVELGGGAAGLIEKVAEAKRGQQMLERDHQQAAHAGAAVATGGGGTLLEKVAAKNRVGASGGVTVTINKNSTGSPMTEMPLPTTAISATPAAGTLLDRIRNQTPSQSPAAHSAMVGTPRVNQTVAATPRVNQQQRRPSGRPRADSTDDETPLSSLPTR